MSQTTFEINGSSSESTPSAKVVAKLTQVQSAMINGCKVCQKRVYDMEKMAIDQQHVFHKNCFRCSHCNGILTVRNYTFVDDKLYCKQHYLRQFKEVGGRYNFSAVQAGQATPDQQTPDKTSLIGVRSQLSNSVPDSDGHSNRFRQDFEPNRSDHSRVVVSSPTATQFETTPTEGLSSPTRIVTGAVAVSNIRAMFETSRNGKDIKSPAAAARPAMLQRSNSGKSNYVEGEAAVISLMKNSSSVKSRMAQFSAASTDHHLEDLSPIPTARVVPVQGQKMRVRFTEDEITHQEEYVESQGEVEEEQGVEEAAQYNDEEQVASSSSSHHYEHGLRNAEEEEDEEQVEEETDEQDGVEQDGVEYHDEEPNDGYCAPDCGYDESDAYDLEHQDIDDEHDEGLYENVE